MGIYDAMMKHVHRKAKQLEEDQSPHCQADREQTARAFVETLLAQDVCLSEAECEIVQHATASLIASIEQQAKERGV